MGGKFWKTLQIPEILFEGWIFMACYRMSEDVVTKPGVCTMNLHPTCFQGLDSQGINRYQYII